MHEGTKHCTFDPESQYVDLAAEAIRLKLITANSSADTTPSATQRRSTMPVAP